jgi:hypothetical protein
VLTKDNPFSKYLPFQQKHAKPEEVHLKHTQAFGKEPETGHDEVKNESLHQEIDERCNGQERNEVYPQASGGATKRDTSFCRTVLKTNFTLLGSSSSFDHDKTQSNSFKH